MEKWREDGERRGFQEDVQMDGERWRDIDLYQMERERESQFGGHRTGDDDASLKPAKVYPNHDRFTLLLLLLLFFFLFAQFNF